MLHFKGWNFCRKFLTNWTAIKNSTHNLQRVRELLRGKFARSRRSRRCTRIFALPNAALTQARTLRRLQRELGRHQAFCAAHARETRENFARGSLS